MKLIASLMLFYPLIVPIWENAPLDGDNTKNPESRTFLTKPEVETQIELFNGIPDAATRSRMVFEIIRSNNPAAVPELLRLLRKEKNPLVKTDLLKALFNMRDIKACGISPILKKLLKDVLPSRRAYAAALMVANSYDLDAVLDALMSENSKFVLSLTLRELMRKPNECSRQRLLEALKSDNAILAAGAAALLAARSDNPDDTTLLAKYAVDDRVSVRSALAASLANRKSGGLALLTTLSKDANSSVRSFVAASQPNKTRLPLYLELAKDVDWDVRRLAVNSLGMINDPKSITSLLQAISDKAPPVRKAAENSLIALKPSTEIMQKMVDEHLKSAQSLPSAITVLGELKFAPSTRAITKILKKSNDDDVAWRSIKALGLLKYDTAWKVVDKRASSANPAIRTAVAESLGIFAQNGSYDTILKLSDDKNAKVASEAIKAMGVTKSSSFKSRILRALKQVQSASTIRSNACWSEARTGEPSSAAKAQLKRLALEQVIPAMGMKEYDSDYVRISATLALVDLGKSFPSAAESAKNVLTKLQEDTTGDFEAQIAGDTLKEFARQAELYMNGKNNIPKTQFPTSKPMLTAKRIK
ncbi:MAG: HEAT repeat domain-containing protein [Victivallales bacterium]|nr:HEAT repeat domain-containing protein [Victivallales bacterium]